MLTSAGFGRVTLPKPASSREVYHHGQCPPPPVLETTRAALVLLDQEPPRQLVFFRVFGLTSATADTLPCYADLHLRVTAEVLHPVRAITASREHVEGLCFWHEGEPDL